MSDRRNANQALESERLAMEICGHTVKQIVRLLSLAGYGGDEVDEPPAYRVAQSAHELDMLDFGLMGPFGDTAEEQQRDRDMLVRQLTWELKGVRRLLPGPA